MAKFHHYRNIKSTYIFSLLFLVASGITQQLNHSAIKFKIVTCDTLISVTINNNVCVRVEFNDSGADDYIILNQPASSNGNEKVLIGFLLNGLDSVTVTGNWTGEFDKKLRSPEYHITILSPRLRDANRFYVKNDGSAQSLGTTTEINDLSGSKKKRKQVILKNSEILDPNQLDSLPVDTLQMNICVFYDDTFVKLKGDDAENEVVRIFYEAQTFFKEFGTSIHLHLQHKPQHLGGNNWSGSGKTLNDLTQQTNNFKREDCHAHVFLSSPTNTSNSVTGKAPIGTVCNQTSERIAIVEFIGDWVRTGRNMAHELGHTLGLHHDFSYPKRIGESNLVRPNRRSFNGHLCTNIGGVMDYQTRSKYSWTTCSIEDFRIYHHQVLKENNNKFCLNPKNTQSPRMQNSDTKKAVLSCSSNCTNVLAVVWYYMDHGEYKRILVYNKAMVQGRKTLTDQIDMFSNGASVRVREDKGNANLEINGLTLRHAGKYKCEVVKQTDEAVSCPSIQEIILEVISGELRMYRI